MTHLKHLIAAATGFAVLATASMASAAPITSFTFDPSATNPALSSSGSAFTADNIIFSQYSSININSTTGAFTDSGILRVANFQIKGAAILPPGFNGTPNATPYNLYFRFSGTGNAGGVTAGSNGTFSTLTAQLYGDVGNDDDGITVTQAGADFNLPAKVANDVLLATGTLVAGTTSLATNPNTNGASPLLPSAFALVNFTPTQPAAGGFFAAPTTMALQLNSSFTNSDSVTTLVNTPTGIDLQLNGGGGNGTLSPVPEPASLALIGAGLAAVGALRRRRG